ncbi:MAG TPA: hypothetical protein VKB65_08600 [Myxococcota bacterium]|nr:hypothetical protein [Myxococcota bacterium]
MTAAAERGAGRGLAALLWAGFAFKAVVTIWGLDRGFGLGDEGTFLLSLNAPETTPANFEFYKLLVPLHLQFSLIGARWLRIATELAASAALVGGLFAFARARLFPPGALRLGDLLPFALLGVGIHVASRSFSYNDMSNLCSYAATAALLVLAAAPDGPAGRGRRALWALTAGFLTGFELAVKFPAFFLLLVLSWLAIVFGMPRLAPRERVRAGLAHAAGMALALGVFVLRNGGVAPLLAKARLATRVAPVSGYDPAAILLVYLKGEVLNVPNVALAALVFAALSAGLARRPGVSRDTACAVGAGVVVALLGASAWTLHPFFYHPTLQWLACFLGFALLVAGAKAFGRPSPGVRADLALLALPLALPVVNLMGSNVPFTLRLPSHALPPFAVLGVLSLRARALDGGRRFHATLAVVGLVVTTASFVHHHVEAPYGLRRPLYEQRERVEGLPGVRVDVATRSFLEASAGLMREAGFRPGDPVIAMDYMPGLVFYLGGRSPGWPFYMFDRPALDCFVLERAGLDRVPFVIVSGPISAELSACIHAFDLPGDFREVGTLRFPYEAVYEGFDAGSRTHVTFLAPRPGARLRGSD